MNIIKKIDVQVEIGMRDCLRNNDIYYGGLIAPVIILLLLYVYLQLVNYIMLISYQLRM